MARPLRIQNGENVRGGSELPKLKNSIRKTKVKVKLQSMHLPIIKRRSRTGPGEKREKVFIQDGERQLSVNCEVDRFVCKFCKIRKYFKDIETLRYHLIMSHNISNNSCHYKDPTLSPMKADTSAQLNKAERTPTKADDQEEINQREKESVSEMSDVEKSSQNEEEVEDMKINSQVEEAIETDQIMVEEEETNFTTEEVKESSQMEEETVDVEARAEMEEEEEEIESGDSMTGKLEPDDSSSTISVEISSPEISLDEDELITETEAADLELIEPTNTEPDCQDPPRTSRASSRSGSRTPEVDQSQPRRRCSERRFEGLKLFKCNHCDLSYSSLENKKAHEETHLEKEHVCVYCDMRFYFPLSLSRHKRIHVRARELNVYNQTSDL